MFIGGSSPPARGTPRRAGRAHVHRRLIPACAGNTRPIGRRSHRRAAHPRLRGEHVRHLDHAERNAGSSPPARGTRGPPESAHASRRLIPACAGNTPLTPAQHTSNTAHPRLRGEHFPRSSGTMRARGSSPPARGTRFARDVRGRFGRLIPACAGNTSRVFPLGFHESAHPRLRGEHHLPDRTRVKRRGSSPPARGTRCVGARQSIAARLIPACAGNTPFARQTASLSAAHPRLRGEHAILDVLRGAGFGSSPPARGTLADTRHPGERHRLIPACAGNTQQLDDAGVAAPAHPRLRGEHRCLVTTMRMSFGSSPPARGTPRTMRGAIGPSRLIPACAGNTDVWRGQPHPAPAHPRLRGEHF